MNPRVLPGLLAWLSIVSFSPACGPFFPDTVLDKPQAALDVPPVSYVGELSRIAGIHCPEALEEFSTESTFLAQLPLEEDELRQLWTEAKLGPPEIDRRLETYEKVRKVLLSGLESTGPMNFPSIDGPTSELPVHPFGEGVSRGCGEYVEAARLPCHRPHEDARQLSKGILPGPQTNGGSARCGPREYGGRRPRKPPNACRGMSAPKRKPPRARRMPSVWHPLRWRAAGIAQR